jgi:hypothetical protein
MLLPFISEGNKKQEEDFRKEEILFADRDVARDRSRF